MANHIKNGDTVIMHTCGEAGFPQNTNQEFLVISNPRDLCGSEVVSIQFKENGKHAYTSFATEFLKKVA